MKLSFNCAIVLLALSNVDAFAVPPRSLWVGSVTGRTYRANPVRREAAFSGAYRPTAAKAPRRREFQKRQGGGLKVGGLTLGGPSGGISGNGLQLVGNKQSNSQLQQQAAQENRNGTVATGEGTPSVAEASPAKDISAGADTAEGEAALLEAQQEAQGEKSKGVKATEESELFSEEAGITLDKAGNAQNLGGNLGITKGTDGSTSVGGENGINVAARG